MNRLNVSRIMRHTFPARHTVKKGTVGVMEGFLMGSDPVLKFNGRAFVVFKDFDLHFRKI